MQWSFTGHAMVMQWSCNGHLLAVPWSCSGHALVIYWPCNGHLLAVQWSRSGCMMVMQWPCSSCLCSVFAVTAQWLCISHARATHWLSSGRAVVLQQRCHPTLQQRLCNSRAAVTRRLAGPPQSPAPKPWEAGEDESYNNHMGGKGSAQQLAQGRQLPSRVITQRGKASLAGKLAGLALPGAQASNNIVVGFEGEGNF